jgi:hypothetical protein
VSIALPALERQEQAPRELSRLSAVVAVATAALFAVAVAGAHTLGGAHGAEPVTAFGGRTAVSVPQAAGLERALGPSGSGRVLRVQCAGTAAAGTGCFTAAP